MRYRLSSINDIPFIAELKLKMFKEVGMSHLLTDHFIEEVISTYTTLYTKESVQHFVIEEEGKIAACAGAFIKDDIPYCFYKDRRYGFIGDVYVEPPFRRKGYARTLTNAGIQWLSDNGIGTVRLLASYHARHLYESMGF